MVFHWSLSDNKSPQVSRTLLSILTVLSNAVIWIVSTRPPTSQSSRPLSREVCMSHFPGRILSCGYTICSYGKILISCTIPCGSSCPLNRVSSYTLSMLICFSYCAKSTNHNWYNSQLFQFSIKVGVLILLFTFFQFYCVISWDSKVDNFTNSLFCCWLLWGLVFWPGLGDLFICQSPLGVYVCYFLGQVLGCAYTIC